MSVLILLKENGVGDDRIMELEKSNESIKATQGTFQRYGHYELLEWCYRKILIRKHLQIDELMFL